MKVKILVVSLSAAVWLRFLQSANCQVPPGMQCNTSAGSAPSVASQGAAVLVADLILSCTGGTPTPPGQTVPQLNVQISLNVNISSRILNNPLTEALLLLDEPDSKTQFACAQPNCANVAGAPVGPALDQNKNVFQGQLSASNSIVWPLVPIDPPGLSGVRVIRITNIRGNAPAVAVAGAPLVILTEREIHQQRDEHQRAWRACHRHHLVIAGCDCRDSVCIEHCGFRRRRTVYVGGAPPGWASAERHDWR